MESSISDRIGAVRDGIPNFRGPAGGGSGRARRGLAVVAGLLLLLVLLPSTVTYINPGHVGILIHRTGGGVDKTPLGAGLQLRNPLLSSIVEYPTYMQTLVLTKGSTDGSAGNDEINVNSVEGQPISMDVSMSFELEGSRVPNLYQTFRTDIETIQHGYVKQAVRQALQEVVGALPIADIIGPRKAEATNQARVLLEKRLSPYGIEVKQFTINELRPPQTVIEAINTKNVMQQQALTAQNELQKRKFNADGDSIQATGRAKAILAEAQAQAEANRLLAQSVSPALIEYQRVQGQVAAVAKWDGKMPMVSGGATPMIPLPKPA